MSDKKALNPIVVRILHSMKTCEITSTKVKASFMAKYSQELTEKYGEKVNLNEPLVIEMNIHKLMKVNDIYHN